VAGTGLTGAHRCRSCASSSRPSLSFARRRPRIAAEDYAARHTIEHTLDRKADLRRLAPLRLEAAERYAQLLQFELTGLREVVAALETTAGGRDLQECLAEAREEIARLQIEVEWCDELRARWPTEPIH
jgi:hypothetical protein